MFKKISVVLLLIAFILATFVPTFAAEFMQSIEANRTPEIVQMTDALGKFVAAIIYDADGNEAASIPLGAITVTPVGQANAAPEAIKEQLTAAYEQLKTTALITIVPEISDAVKAYSPTMTVDDLVIRDLFDVSLNDDAKKILSQSGASIKITFNLNLPADALLLVLHNITGSTWEMIPEEKVTRNADGSATVEFDSLSPIAFLTDGGSLPVNPDAPTSPQTGNAPFSMLLWCALGGIAAIVAALLFAAKKRTVI